jgi:energy-coupling factor transport system ATP-binding protein
VIVLGSSGCGKSFFSMCLNGIVPQLIPAHVTGSLIVNGLDPSVTPVSEMATQVGIVFQDPDAQLVSMYVEDEVVFGPENLLLTRDEIHNRLRIALDLVRMWDLKDVYTWGLSGGQKQRVAIGSVLSMQPSVLVLDEPTSNLDPEGSLSIFELLARLRRETNMTIIAIEHKLDELIEHVDRMIVFDKGQILFNDTPRKIISEHGEELKRKGVNLPQISELALRAQWGGVSLLDGKFPLTFSEAKSLLPIPPQISNPIEKENSDLRAGKPEPIVKFENVSFSYPDRQPALRDINLEIFPAELLAIVGQNGAGKTTLTKMIVGLLKASKGKVLFRGEDISRMSMDRLTEKVGYVFQYPDNQLVTDTVFDEVAFSMRIRNISEDEVKVRVEEVLETVDLTGLVHRHPLTLSMGEKRRLSVATMLVLDQDILILDEPTMGMDWGHIISIMEICQRLKEQGRTILIVTHNMRVVADWADRVIAMADAEIMLDSEPRAFFLNGEVLTKTSLSHLPICEWRDCRDEHSARCSSCMPDFLENLHATYNPTKTHEALR